MFGFLSKTDADNYYQPSGNYVTPSSFKDKLSHLLDYQPLITPDYLDVVRLRKALNIDNELVPPKPVIEPPIIPPVTPPVIPPVTPPVIPPVTPPSTPLIEPPKPSVSSLDCNNWKNLMRADPVKVISECGDSLIRTGYLELASNVRQPPVKWQDIANHLMSLADILSASVFNRCIQLLRMKDPTLFLFSRVVLQKTKRFWKFFVQPNGVPRFTEEDGTDVVNMMEAGRYYDAGQEIFVYPTETIMVSFIIETINRTILSGAISFAQYRLLKEKYPSINPMYEGINCYTAYSSPINVCQSPFEILDQCGLQTQTQSSLMRCATDLYSHTNSDSYNKARNLLKTKYNIELPSLPIDDCSLYSVGYTGKLFTNPYEIYTQCTPLGVESSILINKLIEQIAIDPTVINKTEYDRLRVLVPELPPLTTIICINYVNGNYDSQIYSAPFDVYQQCLPLGVSKRLYIDQVKTLLQQNYKQFNRDQYNRLRETVPEENLPPIPSVSCNGSQDEKCADPAGYINDCIGDLFYTTKSYEDAANEIKQCPVTNFTNTNVDSYNRARDILSQKGITIPPWPSVNCSTISTVDVCTNPEGYLHSCPGIGLTSLDDIVVELRKCGKGNMVDRTNRDGYEKVRLELALENIIIPPLPSVICENDAPATFCANPLPYVSGCPGITYLSLQDYANKLVSQCNNRQAGQTPFTNNYIGDYQAYKQAQEYLSSKGINVIDYQWPIPAIVADCNHPCDQPYLYVSGDVYNPNPIVSTGVLCKPSLSDRANDISQCIAQLGPVNTTDTQFLLPGVNIIEYNKARDYLLSKGITIPSFIEDCYRTNPQYLTDHADELLQLCPVPLQTRIVDSVLLAAKNQIKGIATNIFRSPTISESAYTAFRSTHPSLQLPEWNRMLAEETTCNLSITPEIACDVSKASEVIQYCSSNQKQTLAQALPTCALNYMDTFRTNDSSVQSAPKLNADDYTSLATSLLSQQIEIPDWSSITAPTPEKVCANPLFYATQTNDPAQLQQIAAMLLACATTRLLADTNRLKYMEARNELSKKGITLPEIGPAPTSCNPNDIKNKLCNQGTAIPIINSCKDITPQQFGDLLNQTCNQLTKDSTAVNETTNKYLSFTDQLAGRINPDYFSKDEEVYATAANYLQTLGATVTPFKNPTDICSQPCMYPNQYVTSCNIDPVKAGQDLEKCRAETTPHFQTGNPISVLPLDEYNQARSYLESKGITIGPYPDPTCYDSSPSSLCSVAVYDQKKKLGCPPVVSSDQIRSAAIQCAKNYPTQTTPYIIKDEYNQLQSREPSLPDWDTINPPVANCSWIYSTSGDICKPNDTTSSSGRGDLYRTVIVTKTGTQCEYIQGQQVLQAQNGCDIACTYESNWTDPGLNSCTLSSDGNWYRPLKKTRLTGGGDSCPLEITREEQCRPEPCTYNIDTTKTLCIPNGASELTGKGNQANPIVITSPGRFGGENTCPALIRNYQPLGGWDDCTLECEYSDWVDGDTCSQVYLEQGDTKYYTTSRRTRLSGAGPLCPPEQVRSEVCKPVDCVYTTNSTCVPTDKTKETGKGNLVSTFDIRVPASNGGAACPTQTEMTQEDSCEIPCAYEDEWTQTGFCKLDESTVFKPVDQAPVPPSTFVETGLGSENNPAESPDQLQKSGATQEGYYWYKTPEMTRVRQLYTRFNYEDGKPWVIGFSSPTEEPATINEVGFSIPFKGFMILQVENNWNKYVYFDTPQLFNERTTSEIINKGSITGTKVFIGKPGGHGFYNPSQEVCNWSSALDGIGAGWWDDGRGCGSFPNGMRWGQGFTQDYPQYTNVGKTWETLIWWDGGQPQTNVSPPTTKYVPPAPVGELGSEDNPAKSPQQLANSGKSDDGVYWYKSSGMTEARQLFTRFNYLDGKPWVRSFQSPFKGPASVNEVGYNIPFKGIAVKNENGNTQYSYFSSAQLFNQRNTSDLTTGGNYPGYKVFIGYAGGMGFYNPSQEVCSWSSAEGGWGAGYMPWQGGCGSFPNDLHWGRGLYSWSPDYYNNGFDWEVWITWDETESFRFRRSEPTSIENAKYYNIWTKQRVSGGGPNCPAEITRQELCPSDDCEYTSEIFCEPNATSATTGKGDTIVRVQVSKPASYGGVECPKDRVIPDGCELPCQYDTEWSDPGQDGCKPESSGIYTRKLSKKLKHGPSFCPPELTKDEYCEPQDCEYQLGEPTECKPYESTSFNGLGFTHKTPNFTKPALNGGFCPVKEGEKVYTPEFCEVPCTYGSWSELGSCEFDPSENKWYRTRTAPRLSGGGFNCPNPGIQREKCDPQTCTYTTKDECVFNDSTSWSGRGDWVKTVTSVNSVPYASCNVYVGKKLVTPDGCNYGATGTGECQYTTEKMCYQNTNTKTTLKGDLNETVTSITNLTPLCPVTMVGQSFYKADGCNYLDDNCLFDYTELSCNANSQTSWTQLGDSLRQVTSITNPNNKTCQSDSGIPISYVGQTYTEPNGCSITPSTSYGGYGNYMSPFSMYGGW